MFSGRCHHGGARSPEARSNRRPSHRARGVRSRPNTTGKGSTAAGVAGIESAASPPDVLRAPSTGAEKPFAGPSCWRVSQSRRLVLGVLTLRARSFPGTRLASAMGRRPQIGSRCLLEPLSRAPPTRAPPKHRGRGESGSGILLLLLLLFWSSVWSFHELAPARGPSRRSTVRETAQEPLGPTSACQLPGHFSSIVVNPVWRSWGQRKGARIRGPGSNPSDRTHTRVHLQNPAGSGLRALRPSTQ